MTGSSSWEFQYWDGSHFSALVDAEIDHVLEELNGNEECIFTLPNTSGNLTLIASDVLVNVLYNGTVIFYGILTGARYSAVSLQCYLYNPVFVQLKKSINVLSHNYDNVAADTILADIAALTSGITVGSCPATTLSIKFSNANGYDAVVALAKALGLHYWGVPLTDGSIGGSINIGTRDSTQYTPTIFESSCKNAVDRSKQIGTVVITGLDNTGNIITGSAGSSGAMRVFVEKKASDSASLNNIAALKLALLNNPCTGSSLSIPTSDTHLWKPGQYVIVDKANLLLTGTLIIQRITKSATLSTIEVDVPVFQEDINLQDVSTQTSDISNYPLGVSQVVGSINYGEIPPLAGAGIMLIGLESALPSAGTAGRLYYATDSSKTFMDTGSVWILTATPLISGLTGTISTGQLSAGCIDTNAIAANAVTTNCIAADVAILNKIWASAVTGKTMQTASSGNRVLLGSYTDALGSQNSLAIYGEQIRCYDQSGHFAGGLTASGQDEITLGCPGYTSQGIVHIGAGQKIDIMANMLPSANASKDLGSSGLKWNNIWVVTEHLGDAVFANDWRLTEDGDSIVLKRPDGSVAQRWT